MTHDKVLLKKLFYFWLWGEILKETLLSVAPPALQTYMNHEQKLFRKIDNHKNTESISILFQLTGRFLTLLAAVGPSSTLQLLLLSSRKTRRRLDVQEEELQASNEVFLVDSLKDWTLCYTPPLSFQLDPPFTHTHTCADTQKTHIPASPLAIHEQRLIRL